MSPVPPSALDKFNWAQGHFKVLKAESDAFLHPESYRTWSERNSDATQYRFYVEFLEDFPGTRWGLLFGDGVHSLRSALDHCVYAIGVHESGTDPPPDHRVLEFPITEDLGKWNGAKWHVRSLSDPAQTTIKGLQPHANTDEFAMRDLGALQEFDNADKHRSIRVVACVPVATASNLSGLIPGQQAQVTAHIRPIKSDTPFMTLDLDRPTPGVEVKHNLAFDIGIPHIRTNGQETTILIWPAVAQMNRAVRSVVETLAPYC